MVFYEMAQIQDVPVAQLPQPFGTLGANGTVQNSLQQTFGLVAGQRLQLQPSQQAVLPQGPNSVGCGLASADGGDHTRHILQHQLMHDQCREVVEQMRVVDEYQQRRTVGAFGQSSEYFACQRQ